MTETLNTKMDIEDVATALIVAVPAEMKPIVTALLGLRSERFICTNAAADCNDPDCEDPNECEDHDREVVGVVDAAGLLLDVACGYCPADTARKALAYQGIPI